MRPIECERPPNHPVRLLGPNVRDDGADDARSASAAFLRGFVTFFRRKDIVAILAFFLLYRFAEAQLVKMVAPFLLDPRTKGGLGLSTSEVGIVYGTVGAIALMLGGLLGGWVISRNGLKHWLWIMVFAMMIPAMSSCWIQTQLCYFGFFLWILVSTIPGFIVAAMIKIDPAFLS
ncbi:MAG: hypothetical protein ACOYOS_18725 [Syntrophales bacterium]